MKLYRISFRGSETSVVNGEHQGYDYVSSKAHALRVKKAAAGSDTEVENIYPITVEISKKGILDALNQYGGHPDNG